ncbi:twitch domain-containing radical SAM protein [bacterium]|nr:twitch domain-containing radical SAM protein [bacterium]MDB4128625.1 twitch domain-containing radical SAM protein [bacterium]MDC1257255.1 twitch domain-containing radical SAM protein [bacterium]
MSNQLPINACAYPFKAKMQMHGTPATPCCRFHDRFLTEVDRDPSTLFGDIQATMMRNEWHPGCFKCKADEASKGSSMRTEADEFFDDFTDTVRLEYLEITVGRLCNLACIGCGLEFSHTWDKDSIALDLPNVDKLPHFKKNAEMDLDNIDLDHLRDVKFIKVTGGEPFLHKQFINLVSRLADSGLSKQIDIEIFTNSTWYPKKVDEDALLSFKKVTISASIDGWGELNNVVRYPAKWTVLESTFDKWLQMRNDNPDKVEVMIACTVNVLNAPTLFDFMLWARIEKRVPVILQTVYEPHYLSIEHWPDWFKRGLKYTIDQQFGIDSKRFPDNRLNKAYKLLTKITRTTGANHDNSDEYLAEMQRVFDLRGHTLDDVAKFKRIVETFKP